MLRALLANKLGRGIPDDPDSEEGTATRDFLRPSEDALTATVFGRLLFLPPDRAHDLVGPVVEGDARLFGPDYPEAHLWPGHRLDNRRVEPDAVLVFQQRVVIVEVKWGSLHDLEQWRREVRAVAASYRDQRELHLVLVGRERQRVWALDAMRVFAAEAAGGLLRPVRTAWLSWERLYEHVERLMPGALPPWERAILADVRDALADRGVRRVEHLATLSPRCLSTSPATLLDLWPLAEARPVPAPPPMLQTAGIRTAPGDLLSAWRL